MSNARDCQDDASVTYPDRCGLDCGQHGWSETLGDGRPNEKSNLRTAKDRRRAKIAFTHGGVISFLALAVPQTHGVRERSKSVK